MMMVVLILFAVSFGVDFHLLDLSVAAALTGFMRLLRVLRLIVTCSFNFSVTFVFILHGTEATRYERIFGYNSTTSTTTTTTEKIRRSIRTWPTFLSPSSFSILLPLPLLCDRFKNNLNNFRGNYVIISLFIFFIHLPISTIIFLIIIGTIIYFYFETRDPVILILLSLIAVGVAVVAGGWRNVVLSVFRAGFLVGLHATFRISDAHCDTPFATLFRKLGRIRGSYTGWFDFLLD